MLEKHQAAPVFSCENQQQQLINLIDFKGQKNVVLYFYPKDDTPGCTIEANDFTRLTTEFAELDTVVIGVSKDCCESHQAFIAKFDLKIDLLADVDGAICESYGVWREREKDGVKKMAILRSTFIIDKQGLLTSVHYGVTPDGHAEAMLTEIKQALC